MPFKRTFLYFRFVPGLCAILLILSSGNLSAQEGEEFRSFTDKQGRNVTAKVLSISDDRKVMTITDEAGQNFDLEIVKLSLNDQQYLKEWVSNRPSMSNFQIRAEIEKVRGASTKRLRSKNARFETEHPAYRIKISNLTRKTLEAPVVEYLIARRERVEIYSSGGKLFSRNSYEQGAPPEVIWKEVQLGDLAFNEDAEFVTAFVEIDKVFEETSKPDSEDVMIGLIVRVRDNSGNLIGEYTSSDSRISDKEWVNFIPDDESLRGSRFIKTRDLSVIPETLQQGDTVVPSAAPSFVEKKIKLSALITLGDGQPSGVLFEFGGDLRGCSLEIQRERLQWWIRRANGKSNTRVFVVQTNIVDLPSDEFLLEVTLDEEKMSLSIDGEELDDRKSPGLLSEQPGGGITIGHPRGTPVSPGSGSGNFTGRIRDVRLILRE